MSNCKYKEFFKDIDNPEKAYRLGLIYTEDFDDVYFRQWLRVDNIPSIPRDYISHFVRGYYEANGGLYYLKGSNNFRISFVGNKDLLQEIQKEIQTSLSIQKHPNQAKCFLQVAGRKEVVRILNYLYKDSEENTRLTHKYNLYQDCLAWAHRH